MMGALIRRADEIAHGAQQAKVLAVATRLKTLLGEAAVEAEDRRVVVRGRGIIRRWLIEPGLRFLK
jgi:hypothetical protein